MPDHLVVAVLEELGLGCLTEAFLGRKQAQCRLNLTLKGKEINICGVLTVWQLLGFHTLAHSSPTTTQ